MDSTPEDAGAKSVEDSNTAAEGGDSKANGTASNKFTPPERTADGKAVVCPQCTLHNPLGAREREACGYPLKAPSPKKPAQAEERKKKAEEGKQQAMKDIEQSLPIFLEFIWEISAQDIEKTVADVTKLYLRDVSVPWIIRMRR